MINVFSEQMKKLRKVYIIPKGKQYYYFWPLSTSENYQLDNIVLRKRKIMILYTF